MSADASRAVLESAYHRLAAEVEARHVTPEHLKSAALDALARAKEMIERDPQWVAGELDRINAITEDYDDKSAALVDG